MNSPIEDRYRRMLRWYSKSWRRTNEEVVLGTMLDAAEHEGRTRPAPRERAAVMVHGLGTRLSAPSALGAALLGLVLSAIAGALTMWTIPQLYELGLSWTLPLLTVAVIPLLAIFGLIALARHRGVISSPRALVVIGLSTVALTLTVLAHVAWSLGFDLADEGVAATGLAAVFAPLFLTAWLTGAAAVAVFLGEVFARTGIPGVFVALLTALCSGMVALVTGVALVSPMVSTFAVAGVAILSLFALRPARTTEDSPRVVAPSTTVGMPRRTIRLARLLAWISVAGGVIGVGYALTGQWWSSGATDGTVAIGQGITISALAGLPLLGATVVIATSRRSRALATCAPALLFALSLCAIAAAYHFAPSWDAMAPALTASSALAGAAIACGLATRLPGPMAARILTAALLGIGYAVYLGTMLAPALTFLLPVFAATYAIWGTRAVRPLPSAPRAIDHAISS